MPARELVLHLTSRELRSTHRRTALGWLWPLLIQLCQLGVLVFVFDTVVPLDVQDYPVFVFSGLVFWSWFRGGVSSATTSVSGNGPLVLEPRTPRAVLPLVAVAVATFDLLVALPVLLVIVVWMEGVDLAWLLIPPLIAIQAVLMAGLAFIVSALQVFVRDVAQLVSLILLLLFYLTPVFYPRDGVPEEWAWIFDVNPISGLIEAHRTVLLDGHAPAAGRMALLGLASLVVLAVGWVLFRRLEKGFADEL